jgi:hypothetical protein
VVVAVAAMAPPQARPPLAQYRLGAGWATFGLALPQGAARAHVTVGALPTQTDVKTTWPDGSIRFAIVTTRTSGAGTFPITAAAPAPAAPAAPLAPPWPEASVTLAIAGQPWVAALSGAPVESRWLYGPLVAESRVLVTPHSGGTPHPFLRVIYDVRCYRASGCRVDVTVENVLDHAAAKDVTYDVAVSVSGKPVLQRNRAVHGYLARWRRTFNADLRVATVVPDVKPFVAAQAWPAYMPTVIAPRRAIAGEAFDILRTGDWMVPMNAHGGRQDIAPYPDWVAQYLVHRRDDQREHLLRQGELAGSFGVHIKGPDGRLISIDERPSYWLDGRADPDGRPRNGLKGRAEPGDNAHQPSMAYVPYLLTGDRFYLDEMQYWANFCLLSTFQDSHSNARSGSQGLLGYNEVRGIGWALRNLADAAAYSPDSDPYRRYFTEKVQNNLAWLDTQARTVQTPLGTMFSNRRPEDTQWPPYAWIALWEQTYVAWSIDHALRQGFTGGAAARDRIAKFQLKLFTSEAAGYDRAFAGAYVIAVGVKDGNRVSYFATLAEVFRRTKEFGNFREFQGYYGPEARLMLLIARDQQWPGAEEAYAYLMRDVDPSGVTMRQDLERRSGWGIEK